MTASDSSNTHEVISTLFRAMNATNEERESAGLPRWSRDFPYVNGGLFKEDSEVDDLQLDCVERAFIEIDSDSVFGEKTSEHGDELLRRRV